MQSAGDADEQKFQIPIWSWLVSAVLLIALVVVIATHLGEAEKFVRLFQQASPVWLLAAVALQVGTYSCEGAIWHRVMLAGNVHLPMKTLAKLAVEKLTVNQMIPTGGLMGNVFVMRTLRRKGVPSPLIIESILVSTLTYYGVFAMLALLALCVLWIYHGVQAVIISLMTIFAVVLLVPPLAIIWILLNRNWQPPRWLMKSTSLLAFLKAVADVSARRVLSPKLLSRCAPFQAVIFILDAYTLWATLLAVGVHVSLPTAFVALIIATIAATVSFLPGGVGSFEGGCTLVLTLLGVPIEAALTGTLLLRGLTFWLPLIPGIVLVRQEMHGRRNTTL